MNISTNTTSIQYAQSMLDTSAKNVASSNVASSNVQETDLAKEMATQMVAQNSVEANVTAIKSADDVLGTLLDIKA
ncbi:MAG: hypothetical protein JXQ67_04430 [Campylobacterales bacterium]|nr:hypothetical protein [Campylobacterales bacterium]